MAPRVGIESVEKSILPCPGEPLASEHSCRGTHSSAEQTHAAEHTHLRNTLMPRNSIFPSWAVLPPGQPGAVGSLYGARGPSQVIMSVLVRDGHVFCCFACFFCWR